MIFISITDKNGKEVAGYNCFNATLKELKANRINGQGKFIDKIEDHGRYGFKVYYMNGNVETLAV